MENKLDDITLKRRADRAKRRIEHEKEVEWLRLNDSRPHRWILEMMNEPSPDTSEGEEESKLSWSPRKRQYIEDALDPHFLLHQGSDLPSDSDGEDAIKMVEKINSGKAEFIPLEEAMKILKNT